MVQRIFGFIIAKQVCKYLWDMCLGK